MAHRYQRLSPETINQIWVRHARVAREHLPHLVRTVAWRAAQGTDRLLAHRAPIELAERLGGGTDFVRVDLYDLPDRIVFGELSSFPAGGDSPFEPESFTLEFGNHWHPPRRYR